MGMPPPAVVGWLGGCGRLLHAALHLARRFAPAFVLSEKISHDDHGQGAGNGHSYKTLPPLNSQRPHSVRGLLLEVDTAGRRSGGFLPSLASQGRAQLD